jgi:hypothetical protein
LTRTRDSRRARELARDAPSTSSLARGFDVDQNARCDRLRELGVALPGPAKLMPSGSGAGVQRHGQLAARRDIDAVDNRREKATTAGIGLAFIA